MIMHNWVTSNQYTSDLLFTASAASYKPGDTLTLSVVANGTKYVNAPMGVYLAVQAFSQCTLYADHGKLSKLSADLAATPACNAAVYSTDAFTGKSTMTWVAGKDTVGPVTFTVIWSNGPSGTDPLAVSGVVRVPDTYLYMKTVTISGPAGPCPSPPIPVPALKPADVPGRNRKCHHHPDPHSHECPHAGVNSPVFIQTLANDEGQQTFPAGRCVPCRIDHRHRCKSAMVSCPTSWKKPHVVEQMWETSTNCSGEPDRVATVPSTHAHCPSAEHYSIDALDLERFVPKLQRDHKSYFPDEETARKAIAEYRRMLKLVQRYPSSPVVPSKLVDLVWHEHILDTMQYRRDTLRMFGQYIHHNPSFGGDDEKAELVEQQDAMFGLYRQLFGEAPPPHTWPAARKAKAQAGIAQNPGMPDCCSARCAKPACHDCVSCNSVDCGYMAATAPPRGGDPAVTGAARRLAPDAFAGYVPLPASLAASPPTTPPYDSCSVTPQRGMKLDWGICGDRIYFEHSLADPNGGWYGLGLSGAEPYVDMSGGDYMLTWPTGNLSGIKDMYRHAEGSGYPCFDVEFECSIGNKTKGTADFEDADIVREGGVTTSSWNRHLGTADYKDRNITDANMTVMFARGRSDFFYYHEGERNLCTINFYDGNSNCTAAKDPVGGEQ